LILRKIIKTVATKCHILKLKCIKLDFGWGSAPGPAGGVYSAPPDPQLDLRGPACKERERRKDRTGGPGRGEDREGDLLLRRGEVREERKGRGGKGREVLAPKPKHQTAPRAGMVTLCMSQKTAPTLARYNFRINQPS